MKFTVPAQQVKAAQKLASSDKSRRIINAVHFEPSAQGVRIAATDSYRLGVFDCAWGDSPREAADIDCAAVARAVRKASRAVEFDTESGTATVYDSKGAATSTSLAPVIEGAFPEFEKLIPSADSRNMGFAGFVDPAYAADALAVLGDVCPKRGVRVFAEDDMKPVVFSAAVEGVCDAMVLVMPIRGGDSRYPGRDSSADSEVRKENAELKRRKRELLERIAALEAEKSAAEIRAEKEPEKPAKERPEMPEELAEAAEAIRAAGGEVSFNGTNAWAEHVEGVDFEALGFARCKKSSGRHAGQWYRRAA